MLLLLLACTPSGDDSAPGQNDSAPVYDANPPAVIGGDRPAEVVLPGAYAVDHDWPLVILLHGYGATSDLQDVVFGLAQQVDSRGFILVKPEGTVDSTGAQFWNATEECCNFYGSDVDDVGYLTGLIDTARATYPISTVALVGHSNGGFMAYRMACEVPDRLDRIGVLAGAVYKDEADCAGTEPVSVVHIHGTLDETIVYESTPTHAGAEESIGRWVTKAGCDPTPEAGGTRDYLNDLDGEETTVSRWTGCAAGKDLQLWSAAGGTHLFLPDTVAFQNDLASWLVE